MGCLFKLLAEMGALTRTPLSQNLTVRWHYLLPPLKIAKSPWNPYLCNACMQIQDSNTSR